MSDQLTLQGWEAMIAESYLLEHEIDAIEDEQIKPLRAKLAAVDRKILAELERQEISSYKSKYGTVVRSNRFTVPTPKTIEEKTAFFGWLNTKGREVYWQFTTINSQSLNALYKAEMEIAKEQGNFDFKIPGLAEPTFTAGLSRRKK